MKRRDFLDPRRLAAPAGELLGVFPPTEPAEPAPSDAVVLRFSRRAMATTFEVILPFGTRNSSQLADSALDLIDELENQLTVFRPASEVSRLNARAAEKPIVVEKGLFDLLLTAQRLHAETAGAFDITSGTLVKAWGFYRRQGRIPSESERQAALAKTGMKHVRLDAARRSVAFLTSGLEINLGSIGKGYAIDRAAERLQRQGGIRDMLLHGGRSSIFALGSEGGDRRGWRIGVTDPENVTRNFGEILLKDRGLATSATTYQRLEHERRRLGHLLDPRTGWPACTVAAATVTAPTATEADALSTAFFILGEEHARAYCASHPEIGVVLVPLTTGARPVVLGEATREFAATRW